MFRRWLYLTHRWIGIVTCLFFAMWFASGLVMVYVPFPSLEREEWLAGQNPIAWDLVQISPDTAVSVDSEIGLQRLTLEMRGTEPVWRWQEWGGESGSRSAVDGRAIGPVEADEAQEIATAFSGSPIARLEKIRNDQWTVPNGYDAHRPLWKAYVDGDEGRQLYISSRSGEVILETERSERFWNWLGSIPHWIYFTVIREDQPFWRQIIIWLSGPCVIAGITGVWIGILRVRLGKRRFAKGSISPYRGWMKWHHISGLAGGLMLVLWIFSGWLSVDPGRVFASNGIGLERQAVYGGSLRPGDFVIASIRDMASQAQSVTLTAAAGQPLYRIEQTRQPDRLLAAGSNRPPALGQDAIVERFSALFPETPISSVSLLTKPDAYWYSKHGDVQLPTLRLKLADEASTWIHVDPQTGEIHNTLDQRRRTYRWLYTAFHTLDIPLLLNAWPARDVVIWLFSILGFVSSITGVYVGWKHLSKAGGKSRRVATP